MNGWIHNANLPQAATEAIPEQDISISGNFFSQSSGATDACVVLITSPLIYPLWLGEVWEYKAPGECFMPEQGGTVTSDERFEADNVPR